jgi:hypothetical protein
MKQIVAVASVIACLAAPPLLAQEEVAEPNTGVKFAAKVDGMTLLGTGLRIKKILFIHAKVYAVALYVSDEALKGPLLAYKGKESTPQFFDELTSGDFQKRLVLRFVRDVGASRVQDAMREALADRTDKTLLDRFVSYFPEVKDGQECVLEWAKGGILETTMVGQTKPPIESKAFSTALFGLYVGAQPLQEDIKQGLVSRVPQLLAAE